MPAPAQGVQGQARAKEEGFLKSLNDVDQAAVVDKGKAEAVVSEAKGLAKVADELKPTAPPDAKPDQSRPEPAKEPAQVAMLDDAARVRLGEVQREVDAKQRELQEVTQRLEQVRRQEVREQTKVDRESYARFYDHPFLNVVPGNELSTFAIDVDTGAYANVRRFLAEGQLPPPDAVRIEEMLNYFRYDDPAPKGDEPFSVNCEVAACPWDANHRLARIGLKGKEIDRDKRPTSNLVFLIDVSGSMADLNKLPLLKAGMKLLVEQLTENDRVGIVTYSNDVKEAFPSTPCHRKAEILAAIDGLQAGGGTNGGAGIQMAYKMAEDHFLKGGNATNRVILATDGDFNVGLTKEELLANSEARAKSGIFLTVLGFGEGNLQEDFMEQLADKGNGHYRYIDTIDEARKTLVRELSGTLVTIAKDVKVQVEFNPDRVASYRLIGYENRVMAAEDFRNDKKDAGEIGAGHSVTALYEFVPAGAPAKLAQADRPLKYRRSKGDAVADKDASPECFTVYLRYKQPDGDAATEFGRGVVDDGHDFGRASTDLKFASSVAGFGMLLRGSPYKGSLTYPAVLEIASSALGSDPNGDRKGFLELIRQAMRIEGVGPDPVPLAAPVPPQ
jgi:Ca-activated chloride channel family protein